MALNVEKHIICELTGYRTATVDVSQGDRGSRAVSCRLMENGVPWTIPEGATARVAYTLPNGTEGLYDRDTDGQPMWRIAGNTVTVELADQLMAHPGMVQMSILIIGPAGEQLATWPIRVNVASNRAARLTVSEGMPTYGDGFKGKIFYGGEDGTVTPLELGPGVEIRDGVLHVAGGGNADCECGPVYVASEEPPEDTKALWVDTTPPGGAVALGVTAVETAEGVDLYCTDELGTTKVSLRHGKDGNDSGQNLDYSAATNKPSINGVTLEGNKTAEQLGIGQPTDEQVGNAVNDYLTEHPVAAGATPEQVAQLEFATNTDAALFATLETGSLYDVDLSKFGWYDGVYLHWNTTKLIWGNNMTKAGHHYLDSGWIELRKGDVLITNADTDVKAGANHYLSCLVQKKESQLAAYDNNGNTMVMQGRGAYDGLYRTYTATDDVEYLRVAYQYDVDYDVHFYVARARTENAVPFDLYCGYLKKNTGEPVIVSETNWGMSGYYYEVISSLMTISAPGKFLLIDYVGNHDGRSGYCWCRYAEDGSMVYGMYKDRGNKGYYIIPLFDETERIRFSCILTETPYQYITAQLVDAGYLIRHGYASKLAGKKMVGFGDSYVAGHSLGVFRTALYRIAEEHQMKYTAFGHNGWGICRGPLTPTTLADVITEELSGLDTDYIVVWAGRNDYTSQAPIGTNDDMADMSVNYRQRTFKGSLNYICKFLVENYPGKKVTFFTPWYFPSTLTEGETHKPVEYIDAIKEICGIWGIPVLDCARDCGIHVKSEVFRSLYFLSTEDFSHLNWDGNCLFADGPGDDWLIRL